MASFAAASSWHPLPTQAVGEVVGGGLESIGSGPDLAVLFVGNRLTGALEDIVAAVRALLRPVVLLGATAPVVLGGETSGADGHGLVLWAGVGFDAEPLRGPEVDAGVRARGGRCGRRVLLDDLVVSDERWALRSTGRSSSSPRTRQAHEIGEPFVATATDGRFLLEGRGPPGAGLGAAHAADRLDDVDRSCARRGLALGLVVDETVDLPAIDDLALIDIAGGDRARDAVALDGEVEVGAVVQLVVHDPDAGDRRL